MFTKLENFIKKQMDINKLDIHPGDIVRVHQQIKEKDKTRIQIFEGRVLAVKHGKEAGATITVMKDKDGISVERIFPVNSPVISKIEIIERGKTRRSKLYYLRGAGKQKSRLKKEKFSPISTEEEKIEEKKSEEVEEEEKVEEKDKKPSSAKATAGEEEKAEK